MKRWHLISDLGRRKKAQKGRCITACCRKKAPKIGFKCHKCRQAGWRERNPLQSSFANLRSHAKQRGILFQLSFAHFKEVATSGGYVEGLNGALGLSVDRTNDERERCYRDGQIRVIFFSENVAKENRRRAREAAGGYVADPNPF